MLNKKEIQSFCNKCRETYNSDTNSVICPHKGFPRTENCIKHKRNNCGHAECQNNLLVAKFSEEKRA